MNDKAIEKRSARDEFLAPVEDARNINDLVIKATQTLSEASGGLIDAVRVKRLQVLTRMACQKVPLLLRCTRESFFWAMIDAARCGLEWDGEHGALVPYKDQAKFVPMMKGHIDLIAEESGVIVTPFAVYRDEPFTVHLGTDQRIEHRMVLTTERSDDALIAAYAVFQFPDGRKAFDVMGRAEIDKRKAVSKTATRDDSPWKLWYAEKAKVTVIKHGAKYLPRLGPKWTAAVEIERRADMGEPSLASLETPANALPPGRVDVPPPTKGAAGLREQMGMGGKPPPEMSDADAEEMARLQKERDAAGES